MKELVNTNSYNLTAIYKHWYESMKLKISIINIQNNQTKKLFNIRTKGTFERYQGELAKTAINLSKNSTLTYLWAWVHHFSKYT